MKIIIEESYGLTIDSIHKFNRGFTSNNWILTDKYGVIYFMKEMPFTDMRRVEFINKIQFYLYMKGLSSQIILTTDNKDYIIINNSIYVLYEYLKGDNPEVVLKIEKSRFWGCYLGQVHSLLEQHVIESEVADTFFISEPQTDYLNNLLKDILLNKLKREVANYKYERLKNHEYRLPITTQWRRRIIHGDFYQGNIIQSDIGTFLIDFDKSGYFYQEYELMRGAILMNKFRYDDSDTEDIILHLLEFISGYLEYGHLLCDFSDLIDLYDYMLLNDLYLLKLDKRENNVAFMERRYKISKWLYKNKENLKRILEERIKI